MVTLERLKTLIRAADSSANAREVAWLASRTGMTIQAINNWEARGVPSRAWVRVADALSCSVDELLGRAPPAWPFERFSFLDWQSLTERERGGVEAAMLGELRTIRDQSGKRATGTG